MIKRLTYLKVVAQLADFQRMPNKSTTVFKPQVKLTKAGQRMLQKHQQMFYQDQKEV